MHCCQTPLLLCCSSHSAALNVAPACTAHRQGAAAFLSRPFRPARSGSPRNPLNTLQSVPILLETTFLLFTLNEYLSRTAIMVQPLQLPPQAELKSLNIVDVALPLSQAASQQELQGEQAPARLAGVPAYPFSCL